ncbi:hypothetical protein C1645_829602 [Glomus cerebriforme]|uniref:Uncharacterized protein n=1 Tax=Glomus cerebriforme TaxID=658196 RepID=A0A397SKP5_9GLOM|nr:hypothetical protein C1645_829602 [Glomus cerebriforme]
MGYKLQFVYNEDAKITLKIISNSPLQESKLVLLNPTNKLLIIRQKLKEKYGIDDKFLKFLNFSENDKNDDYVGHSEFAEIEPKDEEKLTLNEIMNKNKNILYIKCKINIDWNFLNEKCKFDYGCTMTFDEIKKANKRAFEMKNCELNEINSCEQGVDEFKTNEERMMKTNLFFSTDINVKNFVKLGMSIGRMKNEESNFETSDSYRFMKHAKISIKFNEYLKHLAPTHEFIEAVEKAIKSNDPENFKQITEEFGQFIPMKVILGGRAHFNERITSTGHYAENSNEIAVNANAEEILKANVANTSNYSKGKSTYSKSSCTKLIGGEPPDSLENFNEAAWVKSLKENYKNWDSIEFQDPVSIFQLLPDDLRKQIITLIGKRIHYSDIEDLNYYIKEPGKPKKFELKKIPLNISKMIQNKDADCSIFATVIDMTESKNDFFTCQILCPPNGKPCLIIHCVQKKFKRRECKLKIGWMVIGYYTDFNFILSDFNAQLKILKNENNNQNMINTELLNFKYDPYDRKVPPCLGIPVLTKLDSSNDSLIIGHHFFNAQEENKIGAYMFSYCSKINHYVKLPDFTFYTLIISNYHINNAYDTIPFSYSLMKKPYIDLNNDITAKPKFISLYSTQKTNIGPIFLKQNCKIIETKSVNCKCKCSFKNKPLIISKNNIECSLFDPYISDRS